MSAGLEGADAKTAAAEARGLQKGRDLHAKLQVFV